MSKKSIEARLAALERKRIKPDTSKIPETPEEFCASINFVPDNWQIDLLKEVADLSHPSDILANVSRRGGKTQIAAVCSVYHAITNQNAKVIIVSPSQDQSQILFKLAVEVFHDAGDPVKAHSETALRLYLNNGSSIIALPASERTTRGYTATLLWIDEAARVDDSLIIAVNQYVATVKNFKRCMMSTPKGQRGFWYKEWSKGVGYKKIKINADEIPRINKKFLQRTRDSIGERAFMQEYYNSFEANEDSVFRPDVIRKCFSDFETLEDIFSDTEDENEEDELLIDEFELQDFEYESTSVEASVDASTEASEDASAQRDQRDQIEEKKDVEQIEPVN